MTPHGLHQLPIACVVDNNSHENQEISIFMIEKAGTSLKLFFEVRERLPDKDSRTRKKRKHKRGDLK
jgi:hypothetical protein